MKTKNPLGQRPLELVSIVAANEDSYPASISKTSSGSEQGSGWSPFEVWRTRVKAEQDLRALRPKS
jgi:hypothetical protein